MTALFPIVFIIFLMTFFFIFFTATKQIAKTSRTVNRVSDRTFDEFAPSKTCPSCHREIDIDSSFCKHCGYNINIAECEYCGHINRKNATSCENCNATLI